jgi:hypothetical protein
MSVPQPIAQGLGMSDADQRDIGAALRGTEVLHEQPSGQSGNVQEVRLGHHQRLLGMILPADAQPRTAGSMTVKPTIEATKLICLPATYAGTASLSTLPLDDRGESGQPGASMGLLAAYSIAERSVRSASCSDAHPQ